MPAKNRIKQYQENGYYHIYNRGVEKRLIFQDEQDYKVFLSYLKEYLESRDEKAIRLQIEKTPYNNRDKLFNKLSMNNFADSISLLAFCLMPNHFHLLIYQKNQRGIARFMSSLATRYVMYFNKKYNRVGGLFQGRYKAVLINTDDQLLHVSRYIHLNPPYQGRTLLEKSYSSLPAYFRKWQANWIKTDQILSFFSKTNKNLSYEAFVMGYQQEEDESIEGLKID